MCGIVGAINFFDNIDISITSISRMINVIKYRGPDESGAFCSPHSAIGSARLSIIGLSGGCQPIGNEDKSLWIVYNGETFNYLELKNDLLSRGHHFSTNTDTEVVLHLYEEFGQRCLEKMNGEFAFAIWDARQQELFLARDRVGIRPLYYIACDGKIAFASEAKALFVLPNVSRAIDPAAIDEIFTFWSTLGARCLFQDIRQVRPGHYLTFRRGQIREQPYWVRPHFEKNQQWSGSLEDAQQELADLLLDAVRLRLRSDVPVGAYLSGGLDSSITTALIARFFDNRLTTFSMTFDLPAFDETCFQQQLVAHLGTDHRSIAINRADILENLPAVIWHCESPLLRTAPVPLWILSGLVRDNQYKVVLTGEGADEVFGGYNIFKEAKIREFWAREPGSQRRPRMLEKLYPYVFQNPGRGREFLQHFFAGNLGGSRDALFTHRIRWENSRRNTTFFTPAFKQRLADTDIFANLAMTLPEDFCQWDLFSRAQALEMDIFLANYLLSSQGDRVAMAHSLEIRMPFLDHRVIEFAARLPAHWKIRGLNEKSILKRTFGNLLPAAIAQRVKQPYRAPIAEAFRSEHGKSYIHELLAPEMLQRFGYFDSNKVAFLVQKFRRGDAALFSETQNMALIGILSTQLAHQLFIEDFRGMNIKPAILDRLVRQEGLQPESIQCGERR
jgi:asparagine synthase (glutamine-hydrolysing)